MNRTRWIIRCPGFRARSAGTSVISWWSISSVCSTFGCRWWHPAAYRRLLRPQPESAWPLIGLVAQGIPQLLRVQREVIEFAGTPASGASPIGMRISVGGEELMVPDLDYLHTQLPTGWSRFAAQRNHPTGPGLPPARPTVPFPCAARGSPSRRR